MIIRPHQMRHNCVVSRTNTCPIIPPEQESQGKGLGCGVMAIDSTIGQQSPQTMNHGLDRKLSNLKIRGMSKPKNIQF